MKFSFLILSLLFLISCGESNQQVQEIDYTEENEATILAYLEKNNLNAQRSTSGLHYIIYEPGDGEQPTATDNVTVAYKGYFISGKVFDESDATGISFNLQQVIRGWTEGITYFKEGGNGVLLIPSHLGYGSFDTNTIPGGSVLVFDVNLISVD